MIYGCASAGARGHRPGAAAGVGLLRDIHMEMDLDLSAPRPVRAASIPKAGHPHRSLHRDGSLAGFSLRTPGVQTPNVRREGLGHPGELRRSWPQGSTSAEAIAWRTSAGLTPSFLPRPPLSQLPRALSPTKLRVAAQSKYQVPRTRRVPIECSYAAGRRIYSQVFNDCLST